MSSYPPIAQGRNAHDTAMREAAFNTLDEHYQELLSPEYIAGKDEQGRDITMSHEYFPWNAFYDAEEAFKEAYQEEKTKAAKSRDAGLLKSVEKPEFKFTRYLGSPPDGFKIDWDFEPPVKFAPNFAKALDDRFKVDFEIIQVLLQDIQKDVKDVKRKLQEAIDGPCKRCCREAAQEKEEKSDGEDDEQDGEGTGEGTGGGRDDRHGASDGSGPGAVQLDDRRGTTGCGCAAGNCRPGHCIKRHSRDAICKHCGGFNRVDPGGHPERVATTTSQPTSETIIGGKGDFGFRGKPIQRPAFKSRIYPKFDPRDHAL